MLFEYFIQVEHRKLSMPKAATIFAHSFYYEKTTWHFPGKILSEISLFCMKEHSV